MEAKAAIAYKKHRALPKQQKQLDLEGKVLHKKMWRQLVRMLSAIQSLMRMIICGLL